MLPPLPSTALHGALGQTLPARLGRILTPDAEELALPGVTGQAPSAMVLAPERTALGLPRLELARGETISFRVGLIGDDAWSHRDEILRAITLALEGGIGVRPGNSGRGRPALAVVESVELAPVFSAPAPGESQRIVWLTPVRLVQGGHVTAHIDGETLTSTLWRRAEVLARVHGSGLVSFPDRPESPIEIIDSGLHVVSVSRYSSTQNQRMTWPGLVGFLNLAGRGLKPLWRVLRFCEQVQVGKATSFGFGRFVLAGRSGGVP
jgi:hypothetical protein